MPIYFDEQAHQFGSNNEELPEDECLLKPILYQDSHSWKAKNKHKYAIAIQNAKKLPSPTQCLPFYAP